jgi:hypothetical protein
VVADEYLRQGRSLADDLKSVLARPTLAEDLKDLSIAGLLTRLATDADGEEKAKLAGLVEAAKKLGLK